MHKSAVLSDCRRYRYSLTRSWADHFSSGQAAIFIGLNPSTADETADDPTIRRCIGFAKAWDCDQLVMLNLFAFRATDPRHMLAEANPVGPENDGYLRDIVSCIPGIVVAAWGAHGRHMGRDDQVRRLLPDLHALRINADGTPAHPLYLPKHLKPQPWPRPAAEQARQGGES